MLTPDKKGLGVPADLRSQKKLQFEWVSIFVSHNHAQIFHKPSKLAFIFHKLHL